MVKLEENYADELREMRQKFDDVLLQYKNNTDTKQAHYKILAQKDDSDSLQIIRHFEQILKYTERIQRAQTELQEMKSKNQDEIERLKLQKQEMAAEFQKLQRESAQNSANDRKRLKFLVNVSNSVIRVSGGLIEKFYILPKLIPPNFY